MSKDLTTPVQIDTEIARLMGEQVRPQRIVDMHLEYLSTKGAQGFLADKSSRYDEAEHLAAQAEVDRIQVLIDPLEAQCDWPRYFHVTNVNGHVHTSMRCSSCFYDTRFAWRTDLSGLTPEQVVEQEAHNACSVCMPIAPVEQRAARERYNAQQREARKAERDAAKAVKDAAKRARAVRHVDKVVKAINEQFGGLDSFRNDYDLSRYYRNSYELPSQVADTLYYLKQTQEEGRSFHTINEHVKAELTERGIIA
jgi:hypothetical protein